MCCCLADRSMPPGLMLSTWCFHVLDHQTWLLKLCCSSPRLCTDVCTEPVGLLSYLQHWVCMHLLGTRWFGVEPAVGSCSAVCFWDAPSPECLEVVWLSGMSCLGTAVWLSTGTGDTGGKSSAETSLLQDLSWDQGSTFIHASLI